MILKKKTNQLLYNFPNKLLKYLHNKNIAAKYEQINSYFCSRFMKIVNYSVTFEK